jgi:hypothetical protein
MSDTEIRSRLSSPAAAPSHASVACHRIRHTHHLAFSFLRYCGLSLR